MDQTFKLKPEEELILHCCRTQLEFENETKIKSLIERDIDWDYLVQIASMHRLIPLLYWHLKSLDLEIQQPIMGTLKTLFELNINKNLLFLGELFKIIDASKTNELDIIPFKGPILAILVYRNLGLRHFDDLDIFVHQKDVIIAKKIVSSLDYVSKLQLDKNKEKLYIKTQREFKFYNPKNNVNIELHWRLIGLSFYFKDDIFRNPDIVKVKIQNKEISSLTNELTLLLLCVHAAGHRWERLNWLCDISELVKSYKFNWDNVISKAEELGVKRILLVNLLLSNDLIGLKLPEEIQNQISQDNSLQFVLLDIKRTIFSDGHEKISKASLRLKIREGRLDRFMDLFRITFLPTHKEWAAFNLPFLLCPLYYFYRPLKVIKDY